MKKLALLFSIIVLASGICFAQTSGFTYQGKLGAAGSPANGPYQFECKLFDAATEGNQIGSTQTVDATVTAGIFTIILDFGSGPFTSGHRASYLEIAVRAGATGAFTTLLPRQPITQSPYAIRAIAADGLSTACAGCVNDSNINSVDGAKITGTVANATTAENVTGVVQIANGGTGSATQNFVDLTSNQISIGGNKTFLGVVGANSFDATTQYNIGGNRVLSSSAPLANLFVGFSAGLSNTTGGANSFFGEAAGALNIGGSGNSFFGRVSGRSNTTGNVNSFFGLGSGFANIDGSSNSFFGEFSGQSNIAGGNNTIIGTLADVGAPNLSFATALGAGAVVSSSDTVVLGRSTDTVEIPGALNVTGPVGIGTTAPAFKLEVVDSSNTGLRVQTNAAGGTVASFGGSGAFQIDLPGVVGGRFVVTEAGNVGINTNNPLNKLDVAGIIAVGSLGSGGIVTLCRNVSDQISVCSSSLRYKTNIAPFSNGLNFINRLRPIAFSWKDGGMKDVGFGAEDVEKISPLLVTYNSTGQVEGVKYDRLSVLFVNAIKEQQTQISGQQKLIEKQQQQIDLLKQALCRSNPDAAICKSN